MINNFLSIFSRQQALVLGLSLVATLLVALTSLKAIIVPHFVGVHTVLELVCINICFMIFTIQLVLRSKSNSGNFLLLGVPFLFVGVIDLIHTFSYKGLPDFFTPNTAQKSIFFWFGARFLEAFIFSYFAALIYKQKSSQLKLGSLLFFLSLYTSALVFIELKFSDWVPILADELNHITPLKVTIEIILIAIHLFIFAFLLKSGKHHLPKIQELMMASVLLIISGICFSNFYEAHDTVIFLGHVLKCVAYYYILKACLVHSLFEPFDQLTTLNDELKIQTHNIQKLKYQLLHSERMGAIGQSLNSVIHDMNNMLAITEISTRNISKLIASSGALADIQRHSDSIQKTVQKTKALQKLILSKSKMGSQEAMINTVNPLQLQKLLEDLQPILNAIAGATFKIETQVSPSLWVNVSQLQLEQVLMNLVVNAKDAMENVSDAKLSIQAKAVSLTEPLVCQARVLPSGSYVQILISDTGVGIEPYNLVHIFDPYYTTKTDERGTGLGLSTVLDYVLSWNGGIQVESTRGKGTEFTIYIPSMNVDVQTS